MASDPRFDSLIDRLRDDRDSGAAEVARVAADGLAEAADAVHASSPEELAEGLAALSGRIVAAQPAMAPLVALAARVRAAAVAAPDTDVARRAAVAAAREFAAGFDARRRAVAGHAATLLPPDGMVATLSRSSTVLEALVLWVTGGRPGDSADLSPAPDARSDERRVLCFESRPGNEGRQVAAALAEAGVDVTYAVDAAIHRLVSECAAVVLGADSIGDLGVVNKIGSAAVAHAAASAALPVYVLADTTKLLPVGVPQHLDDERPTDEVWRAPTGVRPWNQYFEAFSADLATAIVTENGPLGAAEVASTRASLPDPVLGPHWRIPPEGA